MPLPFHGAPGARQRRHHLPRRAGAAREPDRPRGAGAQDRAGHPQHRAPHPARGLRRRGQALPRDLPRLGCGARAVGRADLEARGHRQPHRRDGGHRLRDGLGGHPRRGAGRPRGLRHPARGGRRQGVEHGAGVGAGRPDPADPRRARLRDGALPGRPRGGGDRGRAHAARPAHQPDLRGLERDHASVHGPRGGRQAPGDRGGPDRSPPERGREARDPAAGGRLLRALVPIALAPWPRRARALRRARPARPAPALRGAERAAAGAGELPRDAVVPRRDGAQAGLPLPERRHRDGAGPERGGGEPAREGARVPVVPA